jgi:hypothetical protein
MYIFQDGILEAEVQNLGHLNLRTYFATFT